MPRRGDHVRVQAVQRHVQHAGGLGRVHQQRHTPLPTDGAQLPDGLDHAGDIAGVAEDDQSGFAADGPAHRIGGDQPVAVRAQQLHGDVPPADVAFQRPHHGVVFPVGADHLVPLVEHA